MCCIFNSCQVTYYHVITKLIITFYLFTFVLNVRTESATRRGSCNADASTLALYAVVPSTPLRKCYGATLVAHKVFFFTVQATLRFACHLTLQFYFYNLLYYGFCSFEIYDSFILYLSTEKQSILPIPNQ